MAVTPSPLVPRRAHAWPDVVLLAAVVALGLVNLGQPFIWDGAFFTLCAQKLAAGAKLYRDVWDVKQPGLFWFFLAAGRLFGFGETGARALDVVWMSTLAVVMRVALGRWLGRGAMASLAALLSVGYAYAFVEESHLDQVEWLVGLPLFVTLWAAIRARAAGRGAAVWAIAAGVAGGVVLVFKLALLPLVGLLWLVTFWPGGADADGDHAAAWTPVRALRALVLAGIGMGAVVAVVVARFAAEGTLAQAYWTWVTYPRLVLSRIHGVRYKTLLDGLQWFVPRWAPLMALAYLGAAADGARRDRWVRGFVAWLVAGVAVLLMQRWSYWQFHFLLFAVPLGALAARGAGVLERALRQGLGVRHASASAAVLVALLCLWALFSGATKAMYFAHDGFLRTDAAVRRAHLRFSRDGVYGKVLDEVRFLSAPGARPGPIFEIGNPLFTYLAGRGQAGPRNPAMLMEFMAAAEWDSCAAQLVASDPAYVFVQRDFPLDRPPVYGRSASFRAALDGHFRVLRRTAGGTWYVPRGDTLAAGDAQAAPRARAGAPGGTP